MNNHAVEGFGVIQQAVELMKKGQSFVMATVVWRQGPSSGQSGSKAVVTESGEIFGWIGGACAEPILIKEAKKVLTEGNAKLIWLGQESEFVGMHIPDGVLTIPISCQSDGALQIYIEPMLMSPHVLIVGRSPMAATLANLVQNLDWNLTLVDANDFTSSMVSNKSIVIVATQGHGDEEAIETALVNSPIFIGVVASRKRGQVVTDYLTSRGIDAEKVAKVKIPVGIDLGHTTHREVAVSILAELVKLRAAGEFSKNISEKFQISTKVEVIDPVCGMTVVAEKSNRPFEFNGTVFYFCAPGCRTTFEKNPSSFLGKKEIMK
jgi:xanthine dehydrogenase accessory factor